MKLVSYKEISERLYYDPSSKTHLRWKISNGRRAIKDKEAGWLSVSGYYSVIVNKKTYLCHRIVYCLCNKRDLLGDVTLDHINRDSMDNSIENLRVSCPKENSLNRSIGINNNSGVLGVHWDKLGFWRAKWVENGKVVRKSFNPVRLFPDLPYEEALAKSFEEAVNHRTKAEIEFYLRHN
jgi:hypothetical protein